MIGLVCSTGNCLEEARLLLRRRAGEQQDDTQDAMDEMEALIAQFDSDLQAEADWVSENERKEQEEIDDWMDSVTQGLIGTCPWYP